LERFRSACAFVRPSDDDIGNLFSEFPGDHLDRDFLILNRRAADEYRVARHSK
jgi:hypothetical protein